MDNAVESAEKTVNPFIELNVFHKENNNMTIITLIDSCRVNPIDKNGNLLPTKKPNPQFHGFGMRSIENIVKKYNGEMTFTLMILPRHSIRLLCFGTESCFF